MSPQTGPDLVSAGYPISRPLNALLGGMTNATQPNVPVRTNLDFLLGGITDPSMTASANLSCKAVAVPVLPGDVITYATYIVGGSAAGSANLIHQWAALYTGTGSAPGTTNAQPTLIQQSGDLASGSTSNTGTYASVTFTFSPAVTITSLQAPYGYIYCSYGASTAYGATGFLSLTIGASAAAFPWVTHSPYLSIGHASAAGGAASAPATIGTAEYNGNPPIVFLW